MKSFSLTVSSPDGTLFQGDIVKLDVRGEEGDLAVMAGHSPFVTTVRQAPIILWTEEGVSRKASSQGGILTVGTQRVILLCSDFQME